MIRAKQVVRYWCGHAQGEVRFAGEVLSQPFGLEGAVVVEYKDDFSTIFIGHRSDAATLHAFFNGGLTLVQADHNHGSAITELVGLSFKVSSRYLEHTLTRDDVIREAGFERLMTRVHALIAGGVPKFEVVHYAEHALSSGEEASAIAYIQVRLAEGRTRWGAGVDTSIELASIKAVLSALNRS